MRASERHASLPLGHAHPCPQQVLLLVEYVSEGFETERSTVAVFFDVAKTFNRVWHAGMSALTRQDVLSEQEFLKAQPSFPCRTPRTQTIYRDRRCLASNSRYSWTIPRSFIIIRNRSTRFILLPLQRAIDELGQWFRKWRIEVNPDKSAAIQFKYGKIRSRLIVNKNTPNLKMLDANIPWQRNYKYLGVTLDKNLHFRDHIERVRNTALFYKARLGAMLGRKSKLSRRNKRTIYKICIGTVMTYASPVFAHAAPKALHRLQDASKRFFGIAGSQPNALLRAAVDYQPPHPTLSVGHGTYLPIHLTLLQRRLKHNDVNDTYD
ncbi:RNA-directed DNA polymerase from mobile element jockey [Eumeta japonica]|uniref:RNA-directed DNA polymerase from mobile element jockey n=1 Tax=Eumeta variegata TaxID=151549 RepID=A0A4C1YBV3_EUMVA|nr:RNA-directed DNA polymerase from mobile element jockey [Eumeta japonica]